MAAETSAAPAIQAGLFAPLAETVSDPFFGLDLIGATLDGVVIAGVIALGAIGVSLLFGILRFAHFAHGDVMTVGAYAALAALVGLEAVGAGGGGGTVSVWWGLPFAMAGAIGVALTLDRLVYRRLRRSPPIILLIASFGIALGLRSLVQLVFGGTPRTYEAGVRAPLELGPFEVTLPGRGGQPPLIIEEYVAIQPDQLTVLGLCAGAVLALSAFLKFTRMGKAMRAVADNPDLARVTGIDPERVIAWSWVIGAGLAGGAGMMLALETRIHPETGWGLLLPIFAAAILGGIGRPFGAVLGALIIGLVQEIATIFPFFAPAYKPAVAFAILILMLIWRPQGLLRGR